MKRNPGFVFKIFLMVGDVLAIVLSFVLAYVVRTHVDPRPYFFESQLASFAVVILSLLPIWIIVLWVSGIYDENVYLYRPKLYGRLLVASAVGMMSIITFSFFTGDQIFPVRLVAFYSFALCFLLLVIFREMVRLARTILLKMGKGVLNVIIMGNNENTLILQNFLLGNEEIGYKVVGVVANKMFVQERYKKVKFATLGEALDNVTADAIIQTDENNAEKTYFEAVNHHMEFMFIPDQNELVSHMGKMELLGAQPVLHVRTTPLVGGARIVKRICDIVGGSMLLLLASPLMLVIAAVSKISEPRDKIFYKEKRLSQYNKRVKIYKFRSMKQEYCMSPEKGFAKMGRLDLLEKFRKNGDKLENDPRVTKLGKFIRKTSLDELPQLINVVKGDISLVGPRALVPSELKEYANKNLILSAKSGLTGLAQVSGRKDISFEERRMLDIYYVQNWSLLMDVQILLKTIGVVFRKRSAD